MDDVRALFEKDRLAKYLGIEPVLIEPGHAVARVDTDDRHLNGLDIVHGGTLFALADFAYALASNSRGRIAVSVSATISYLRASRGGTLLADAREVSRSRRLATHTVRIYEEGAAQDDPIAIFQGTVYLKSDTVEAMAKRGSSS